MSPQVPKRLLAKSGRKGGFQVSPPQSIRFHTREVMRTGFQLVASTGAAQLSALGLDPGDWIDRFRREIKLAALLHDCGKANSHFQAMVASLDGATIQGLRHEAVSFLIASCLEIREWIKPAVNRPECFELVLWAVAGHHRKFPPAARPEGAGSSMMVYLDHVDFHRTLELGEEDRDLSLGPPPRFTREHELCCLTLTKIGGVREKFNEARIRAEDLWSSLPPDEKRYLAALKATLICADVAGSIGRREQESMVDWIPRAFSRNPTPDQLREIVRLRLAGRVPRPFQREVADCDHPVVFAKAGCGTGKTVAAYLWAAQQAPGRRVYFCYPTTGTATEGYRDYLRPTGPLADLIHGRAEIDRRLLDLELSDVDGSMDVAPLGDDEPDPGSRLPNRDGAARDSAMALEHWSTPLVSCTVDTVLGLVQNNRQGLYSWPSIAGSACVFDEIHSYDDALFGALLRFLRDVPGVPCLLMTASLPALRWEAIQEVLRSRLPARTRVADLRPIEGPKSLEELPRYARHMASTVDQAWDEVVATHRGGGKVLWVVNTVDQAIELARDPRAIDLGAVLYHSRFKYVDRFCRHSAVINAFDPTLTPGAALAITTQVAEMSLDLSADLLVTQLAPIPALIQRLGRVNRRAKEDGSSNTRRFIVLQPPGPLPYEEAQLKEATSWLAELGGGAISQRDLIAKWVAPAEIRLEAEPQVIWLDGGICTEPRPLRESSPGIEVILQGDVADVRSRRVKPEEVRIPMNAVPKGWGWMNWEEVGFCRIPPNDCIEYSERWGARWKRA